MSLHEQIMNLVCTLPESASEWPNYGFGYKAGHRDARRAAAELALAAQPAPDAPPLFWYRPRSDGLDEGPLHTAIIAQARRESEGWVPLFPGAAPIAQQAAPDSELESLRKDAGRWRWLSERMLAADFDYNGDGVEALVFEMPKGCEYTFDCAETIDAAMSAAAAIGGAP